MLCTNFARMVARASAILGGAALMLFAIPTFAATNFTFTISDIKAAINATAGFGGGDCGVSPYTANCGIYDVYIKPQVGGGANQLADYTLTNTGVTNANWVDAITATTFFATPGPFAQFRVNAPNYALLTDNPNTVGQAFNTFEYGAGTGVAPIADADNFFVQLTTSTPLVNDVSVVRFDVLVSVLALNPDGTQGVKGLLEEPFTIEAIATPEPSYYALLGAGLAFTVAAYRKRQQKLQA